MFHVGGVFCALCFKTTGDCGCCFSGMRWSQGQTAQHTAPAIQWCIAAGYESSTSAGYQHWGWCFFYIQSHEYYQRHQLGFSFSLVASSVGNIIRALMVSVDGMCSVTASYCASNRSMVTSDAANHLLLFDFFIYTSTFGLFFFPFFLSCLAVMENDFVLPTSRVVRQWRHLNGDGVSRRLSTLCASLSLFWYPCIFFGILFTLLVCNLTCKKLESLVQWCSCGYAIPILLLCN